MAPPFAHSRFRKWTTLGTLNVLVLPHQLSTMAKVITRDVCTSSKQLGLCCRLVGATREVAHTLWRRCRPARASLVQIGFCCCLSLREFESGGFGMATHDCYHGRDQEHESGRKVKEKRAKPGSLEHCRFMHAHTCLYFTTRLLTVEVVIFTITAIVFFHFAVTVLFVRTGQQNMHSLSAVDAGIKVSQPLHSYH